MWIVDAHGLRPPRAALVNVIRPYRSHELQFTVASARA